MKWCKTHADWATRHIDNEQCRWAATMLDGMPEKPCQLNVMPAHVAQYLAGHTNAAQRALTVRLTDFVTPDNPQGFTIQDKPRTWKWWKR